LEESPRARLLTPGIQAPFKAFVCLLSHTRQAQVLSCPPSSPSSGLWIPLSSTMLSSSFLARHVAAHSAQQRCIYPLMQHQRRITCY
jgi:hypothetical protein